MSKRDVTSKIIDEVIRFGAGGAFIGLGVLLPGVVVGLHKPLEKLIDNLDEHDKQRELRRIIYRMKEQGLLAGDYEHGLQITDKARRRLRKSDLDALRLQPVPEWDGKWRIVIYDIPETHAAGRLALQSRLLKYGCFMLQKSTWITPFPCRGDIERLSTQYDVDQYVTYFEAINLDNAKPLLARFKKKYPNTTFKIPKNISID